jgi:hypothetical protein
MDHRRVIYTATRTSTRNISDKMLAMLENIFRYLEMGIPSTCILTVGKEEKEENTTKEYTPGSRLICLG